MIVKVEGVGSAPGIGWTLVRITDGHGFRYEGGINEDVRDALLGRRVAYFEADMGPDGLEIGNEVKAQGW